MYDDLQVQVNPIATYLNDLDKYLRDSTAETRMLSEQELRAYELSKTADNSGCVKGFSLEKIVGEIEAGRG